MFLWPTSGAWWSRALHYIQDFGKWQRVSRSSFRLILYALANHHWKWFWKRELLLQLLFRCFQIKLCQFISYLYLFCSCNIHSLQCVQNSKPSRNSINNQPPQLSILFIGLQFGNESVINWLLLSTVHSTSAPQYLSFLLHSYTPTSYPHCSCLSWFSAC